MANEPDFDLTPVGHDPFGFDEQLNGWAKDARRSIPSPQAATQDQKSHRFIHFKDLLGPPAKRGGGGAKP
jgi:hypothetical protein